MDERQQIYGASILLGIGCSMLLVTSLAMTAELVGDNTVSQLIRSLAYRFLQSWTSETRCYLFDL